MSDTQPANVPMIICAQCGNQTPEATANADGECEVCAALMSLRATLIKVGRVKPDLFDRSDRQLPPSDR